MTAAPDDARPAAVLLFTDGPGGTAAVVAGPRRSGTRVAGRLLSA